MNPAPTSPTSTTPVLTAHASAAAPAAASTVPAPVLAQSPAAPQPGRAQRGLQVLTGLVLALVAAVGAVLSYASLYTAAIPTFGAGLAVGFPLLVNALVLGASLRYVAGARVGRPRAGWRWTAHAGIAATIALNALAAPDWGHVPWHVTAPAVWSVLVELTARDVLGTWRAVHRAPAEAIPARLWVTAPVESVRVWLRMARRLSGEQAAARAEVGDHAAAVEALRLTIPGRSGARARRILRRQLRTGAISPAVVRAACGWTQPGPLTPRQPVDVLRAALGDPTPTGPAPAGPASTGLVSAGPVAAGTAEIRAARPASGRSAGGRRTAAAHTGRATAAARVTRTAGTAGAGVEVAGSGPGQLDPGLVAVGRVHAVGLAAAGLGLSRARLAERIRTGAPGAPAMQVSNSDLGRLLAALRADPVPDDAAPESPARDGATRDGVVDGVSVGRVPVELRPVGGLP